MKESSEAQEYADDRQAFEGGIGRALLTGLPENVQDAVRKLYDQAWSDPTANADLAAEDLQERLHALLRAHFAGKTVKH